VAGLGKECFCEQARKQGINAVEKVESMGDALEFPMQSLSLAVFDQLHHKPTIPRPKELIDTYRKPSEEDISCCLG
jgi:hypothetical protein